MSSLVPLPSAESGYLPPPGTVWNPATWNAVFGSIHGRIVELEAQKSTIEDLINELRMFGLQRLDLAIKPLIDDATTTLALIETQTAALQELLDAVLTEGVPASSVTVADVDGIEAANVQAVIVELRGKLAELRGDLEDFDEAKAPKNSSTFTGTMTLPNGIIVDPTTPPFLPVITRVARTSNTALAFSNLANLVDITSGTFTQTFVAAATLGSGWWCYLRNSGSGDITLDPNASETIDGLTSYVMYPGECRLIQCDGVALRSIVINAFNKTFTTSGTFAKPPGYLKFEGLLWPGGGSGGSAPTNSSNVGTGGSAGRCLPFEIESDKAAATVAVTIGAGGAPAYSAHGNAGGSTSFGTYFSLAGAPGGNYGDNSYPSPSASPISDMLDEPRYAGGRGGAGGFPLSSPPPAAKFGAGAGSAGSLPSVTSVPGQNSEFAGRGGRGCTANGENATAGEAPGGGGGGAGWNTVTSVPRQSGAGARGEIRLWGVV